MIRLIPTLLIAVLGADLVASKHHGHRAPIIDLHGADEFIGLIREDQQVVSIAPRLAILSESGPVCKYELISTDGKEVPFDVIVQSEHEGTAIVKVKDGAILDCARSDFSLHIVAVRCHDDSARSEGVPLRVTVKDTNNHAPEFESPWYSFDVEEGHIYEIISKIQATDADCGEPYGTICRYEITNALEKMPFRLSEDGILSNIAPLNYTENRSHILTVVAHDCGMRRSKSTLITVNVLPKCISRIENSSSEVSIVPGISEPTEILPSADLKFCRDEEKVCIVRSYEATFSLEASSTLEDVVRDCGLNKDGIELLTQALEKEPPPSPEDEDEDDDDDDDEFLEDSESSGNSTTEQTQTASKEQKVTFDGKTTSIVVPENVIAMPIPERFSLSFRMKHARGSKEEQSVKQNILCESDESQLNRHHFGVYIRHCKLELLLRREAEHATAEFRAAEWRWTLPEVCDNQWHSYAVSFTDLENVQLIVDGAAFTSDGRNPEILDDWPLHQTKDVKTKLSIGACFHARSNSMVQFFKGQIASLRLLTGAVEDTKAIECAQQPAQKLLLDTDKQLRSGDSIVVSRDHSLVKINADTKPEFTRLIRKVAFHARGKIFDSKVKVEVKQICESERELVSEPKVIRIFAKQTPPVLSISGVNLINTDQRSLKVGTAMLPGIDITVTKTEDKTVDVSAEHKLTWCKVYLRPSRDMDLEYFSSPAALIASSNVEFEHDKQGILLRGLESVKTYREILSNIHYFNTRPESYAKRLYTVQCGLDQDKISSNEFTVTMSIQDGSDKSGEGVKIERMSAAALSDNALDSLDTDDDGFKYGKSYEPYESNRLQNILEMDLPRPKALVSHHGYEVGNGAVAGGAIAIVVVICVGFLLVLLVVGVLKMRDTPVVSRRRRSRKSQSEGMEWDDAGMNITLNPLEDIEKNVAGGTTAGVFSEEEEDEEEFSDDAESFRDDDEGSDDDEDSDVLPHSATTRPGLEWDDSTLTNVSRTYRI